MARTLLREYTGAKTIYHSTSCTGEACIDSLPVHLVRWFLKEQIVYAETK
jgi:hypothetical protein